MVTIKKAIRKASDLVTLNFWKKIKGKDVPEWVVNASDRFYDKYITRARPYDKSIHLRGNTFVYKVLFASAGQGQIQRQYFKKLKTF